MKPSFDTDINELRIELYSIHCSAQNFIEPVQKTYSYNNRKEEEKVKPIIEVIIDSKYKIYANENEMIAIFKKRSI